MTHKIKIWDEFVLDVVSGKMPFEVRLNDRNYKQGDTLIMEGWDNSIHDYSGKMIEAYVTYVLHGGVFGIEKGYVVMGIKVKNYNF